MPHASAAPLCGRTDPGYDTRGGRQRARVLPRVSCLTRVAGAMCPCRLGRTHTWSSCALFCSQAQHTALTPHSHALCQTTNALQSQGEHAELPRVLLVECQAEPGTPAGRGRSHVWVRTIGSRACPMSPSALSSPQEAGCGFTHSKSVSGAALRQLVATQLPGGATRLGVRVGTPALYSPWRELGTDSHTHTPPTHTW